MSRIDAIFAELRANGRRAVMPFVTAGYPTPEATEAILPALAEGGAHVCEIGIPFSDPIADGPVIQSSMAAALDTGLRTRGVFDMVRRVRGRLEMGLVAMVSCSIVFRFGTDAFLDEAKAAGFDGIIVPDLPLEEAGPVIDKAWTNGLACSLLIAPTTPVDRAEAIAKRSTGFVYLLARSGITGARDDLPDELPERVERLKAATDLPIAVGFGISRPEHVRAVTHVADAAIVGSALVKRLGDYADDPPERLADHAGTFVRTLADGLTPVGKENADS